MVGCNQSHSSCPTVLEQFHAGFSTYSFSMYKWRGESKRVLSAT